MKIRLDYVTNSSSSSYTCVICGEDYGGMDVSLSDAEMYQCENGHTFCESHVELPDDKKGIAVELINKKIEKIKGSTWFNEEEIKERIKDEKKTLIELETMDEDEIDDLISDYEFRYSVPEKYCPICTFGTLTDYEIAKYLAKKFNIDLKQLKDEMKNEFNSYKDFEEFVKN